MPSAMITVARLRRLIGHRVQHQGMACCIIEVLEEGPVLVLQEVGCPRNIQPDQFGKARRRTPHILEISVQDPAGQLSPEFLALGVLPLLYPS